MFMENVFPGKCIRNFFHEGNHLLCHEIQAILSRIQCIPTDEDMKKRTKKQLKALANEMVLTLNPGGNRQKKQSANVGSFVVGGQM